MALKLTLSGGGDTRTLTTGTLSIGRGERNDWVLRDPERSISKAHCVISGEDGDFVLTDLSTNGVFINGARTPTTRDSRTVLTDGDSIRLGDYVITLAETPDVAPPRGFTDSEPYGGPLDGDPLDDPLGRPPNPAFSHPVHHAPAQARAHDPFDTQEQATRRPPPPDRDIFAGSKPRNEFQGPSQSDHADAPSLAAQMPRVVAPRQNPASAIDFDELIGDLSGLQPNHPAATPQPRPAMPDPFAKLDATPVPAAPLPPSGPSPPPAESPFAERAPPHGRAGPAPPPAAAPSAAAPARIAPDAAIRAFLEGAGVPGAAVGADPEAAMRAIGEVFRALTEGVREVLMSRAALKGELRVEQTLLKASNNNALKFSFSPEDAVIALLSAGRPGYMPPLHAAKEAFDDIKTHEIAVVAGMQTALYALLDRFDPDAIEARVAKGTLSSMLSAARKARLWDSFRDLHATIQAEAADDFQAILGRTFAKAYKAQSRKE